MYCSQGRYKAWLRLHRLLRNAGCDTNAAWGSWKHLQHAMVYSKPTVQRHAGLWGKLCMLLARGISGGLRVCLLFGSSQTADVPWEGETCNKWLYLLEANQSSRKGSGPAKCVYCCRNAFVLMQHLSPQFSERIESINKGRLLPVFADTFEPAFCLFWICHPYSLHWVWYCYSSLAECFLSCIDGFSSWCWARADTATLGTGPEWATARLAQVGTRGAAVTLG